MEYEFEQAQSDQKNAVGVIAMLGIGLVGLAIGNIKKNDEDKIKQEISNKQSRINDLEAKWIRSSAQKSELAALKTDVEKLKSKL